MLDDPRPGGQVEIAQPVYTPLKNGGFASLFPDHDRDPMSTRPVKWRKLKESLSGYLYSEAIARRIEERAGFYGRPMEWAIAGMWVIASCDATLARQIKRHFERDYCDVVFDQTKDKNFSWDERRSICLEAGLQVLSAGVPIIVPDRSSGGAA